MWTIHLLGGLTVSSDLRQVTRFRTQKAASLLAYLAMHPLPQSRETLIDLFWPDAEPDVARHNLSNALSFLRHLLEPPGVPPGAVLLADRANVRLNPAAVTVDVLDFESDLTRAKAEGLSEAERLALLLRALERYQGALLPGYYEEWIAPEALRLESLFVQGVLRLAPLLLEADRREQAVAYAQRAVTVDPLSEEATRCWMETLSACGQPGQALRAYRQLERRLAEELDAQPSPALQRLAEQTGQSRAPGTVSGGAESVPPAEPDPAVAPANSGRAAAAEVREGSEVGSAAPRGRLVGAEFLLRTTTRFFGRMEEIDRLSRMLSTPRTRLVTLTGSGGAGKTRLALEVAAHLVEGTADAALADAPTAAVFVSLAPVFEAERLFEVMLRALGIVPTSGQDPLDQLAQALDSHPHPLLVLDNFEQLVEEGAQKVRDLLARSASVKLLVTSRQKLEIEGEREFHLAPLPTSGGAQTPETLLDVSSIALFVDRAQAVRPDFHLVERNAGVVAQLCDYLEGLPLAIELAAARVGVLSPARILEQVQAARLDFLSTRRRDAASRQRTLRAALDWSYQLLSERERAFLAGLSVFRGGWTLAAAQALCGLSEPQTLEMLTLLRDSSLIQVTDTDEGLRCTMLETIREYGQERLRASGEEDAVCRRRQDYFVAYAEQAEPELTGPNQAMWLDRLEIEQDNLYAAIEWCETEAGRVQTHLWLVGALSRFWEVRGYLSLGRGYLGRALSHAKASAPTRERAKALQGAGALARSQGDYKAARALLGESLTISRELGDKQGIGWSLNHLGNVAGEQSDYGMARTLFEESLTLFRELENRAGIANSLNNLGKVAYVQGDMASARTLYEQGLAINRELGYRAEIAYSLYCLGLAAQARGDQEATRTLLEESLAIRRILGDKKGIALSLKYLGLAAQARGDQEAARTLLEESLALFRELGDKKGIAHSLSILGGEARRQGDYETARTLLQESLAIDREMGDKAGVAHSLYSLGDVAANQGDYETARVLGLESLILYRETRHFFLIHVLGFLGHVERAAGDYQRASAHYQESLRLRQEWGDASAVALSLEDFAGLAKRQGQWERALRLLGAAETLYAPLGLTLPAGDAPEYDRTVAAARAALSEEAFAAAWAEGRTMTLEQAVDYVLTSDLSIH